jgi:Amt family ammonium transporter
MVGDAAIWGRERGDFADSGVVHGVGGLVAFIAAWMVGPRYGKYNPDGSPNVIHGHNLTYIVIGTLILIFRWFGFNEGSTRAVTELRASIIEVNTFLSAFDRRYYPGLFFLFYDKKV